MRSCIKWNKSFPYLTEIDEFNIEYQLNKGRQLIKFLDIYGISQRVNIYIPDFFSEDNIDETIDLLIGIQELEKYNITIVGNKNIIGTIDRIKRMQEGKLSFYFSNIIDTFDDLLGAIYLGVSDVFIGRDLGFELDKVTAVIKNQNSPIQVRCYANICQTFYSYDNGLKTFFIRPEDVNFYSNYIDIIEFWEPEGLEKKVLYESYFHNHKWAGNLQEIIKGLKVSVNNNFFITGDFAETRYKCARKCYKGNHCALCDKLLMLSETIKNNEEYIMLSKYHGKEL